MTPTSNLILLLGLLTSIFGFDNHTYELAVRFFNLINTNHLLIATCSTADNFRYVSKLSAMGFQSTVLDVSDPGVQLNTDEKCGIVIEINCPEVENVIQLASREKFFNNRKTWFIILNTHINQSTIIETFESARPAMFNTTQYLQLESENITERDRMEEINTELNRDILKELENESENDPKPFPENSLKRLTELEALPDSEVTLVVPSATGVGRDLYTIHRKTNHSPIEVEEIGSAKDDYQGLTRLQVPTSVRRSNYNRAVLRASCGLLYYSYFNRSDELTAVSLDIWAQMTFTHVKLIEESLNFRMLIKCFDDYGWPTKGVFNGLVGFMQRHHADITATGLLLRNDRMNVMDYVDGTFEFKLGLLFRQPNLASVTNIFILPFSRSVWIALCSLLIVAYAIIWWQLRAEGRIHKKLPTLSSGEVFSFLTGVVSQQGYYLGVNTVAVRVSMLVILISSLFLFTSYSATIVALLQSPAGFINSLGDFLSSPLGIGIEDLPYEKKFLEEDDHDIISEILTKKVLPQGNKAYVNTSEGINRVRNGFYAFQCELSNGYKLISETYTAREKCGLKKLDMFPNRILGPGTTKKSPYKEILACKMRWLREVGLTHRTVSRWSHRKPICESSRSGFFSVGIKDIKPLILIFTYGLLIAIGLVFIECAVQRAGIFKQEKPVKFFTKRTTKKNIREYAN